MAFYNNSYMGAYQQYPNAPQYLLPAQTPPQTNNNNGFAWVQGENGAKSYLVAPNTTVLLMDSESPKFYLKSIDNSGFPMPLRVFEYKELTSTTATEKERTENDTDAMYVTKSEFEAFKDKIEHSFIKGKEAKKDE